MASRLARTSHHPDIPPPPPCVHVALPGLSGSDCDPNTLGDGEEDNDVPRLGVKQMAGAFILSFVSFLVSVLMFIYGQIKAHMHDEKIDETHAERRATQTFLQMPLSKLGVDVAPGVGMPPLMAPAPKDEDKSYKLQI